MPYTYYVLTSVSTCPTAIPLQDYLRHTKITEEEVKAWNYLEQSHTSETELIRVYLNPLDNWIK